MSRTMSDPVSMGLQLLRRLADTNPQSAEVRVVEDMFTESAAVITNLLALVHDRQRSREEILDELAVDARFPPALPAISRAVNTDAFGTPSFRTRRGGDSLGVDKSSGDATHESIEQPQTVQEASDPRTWKARATSLWEALASIRHNPDGTFTLPPRLWEELWTLQREFAQDSDTFQALMASTKPSAIHEVEFLNGIRNYQAAVSATARDKGWWPEFTQDEPNVWSRTHYGAQLVLSKLALIHSEVSEALECARQGEYTTTTGENGKPEGFAVEIADIFIRCFDLCGALHVDLAQPLLDKAAFNKTRSHRHGGKLA